MTQSSTRGCAKLLVKHVTDMPAVLFFAPGHYCNVMPPPVTLVCATGARTYLTTLRINRGMSWENALAFRDKVHADRTAAGLPVSTGTGFYINSRIKNQGQTSEWPGLSLGSVRGA